MVGAHGVETVVAVGEMAEAVVGALEWRHDRQKAKDVAMEWDWAEVESDLDLQRRENARLRATIHMYEQAFLQLHQQKLASGELSVDRSMGVSVHPKFNQNFPLLLSMCISGFHSRIFYRWKLSPAS